MDKCSKQNLDRHRSSQFRQNIEAHYPIFRLRAYSPIKPYINNMLLISKIQYINKTLRY